MLVEIKLTEHEYARLRKLLRKMNLPDHRRGNLEIQGARWLHENLKVRNESHPDYQETLRLLKKLAMVE